MAQQTLASGEVLSELRHRIAVLTAYDVPLWGRMDVGQMVCHLTDAFEIAVSEEPVVRIKAALPGPVIKFLALRVPREWPHGVATVPAIDQAAGRGTRPGEFEADRARLLASLERFVTFGGTRPDHPIFGAMTTSDWMRWGWLHPDHHLRQFGR